jgi:hypothetical protein
MTKVVRDFLLGVLIVLGPIYITNIGLVRCAMLFIIMSKNYQEDRYGFANAEKKGYI